MKASFGCLATDEFIFIKHTGMNYAKTETKK